MEDIAISGISGRFPKCANVEEFKTALLNNELLLTDNHTRWPTDLLGTPSSLGIVDDFHKFDASFFGLNPKQAEAFDPKTRKLLEVVYEAIVDSGNSINDVKGSNTGVFLGTMQGFVEDAEDVSGVGIFNRSIALIANTISFTFDLKGPSYALDTGCSSAIYGINQAVDYIRSGACDSALVCGTQTHLIPYESVEFSHVKGLLSEDNRCRPFDKKRSGYIKADAVAAVFLQKRPDCKRIYATIAGVGSNVDGYKEDGLIHPSWEMQYELLKSVYSRYKLDPNEVFYVEAHGTGTVVGDEVECRALKKFFCESRKGPLYIGSVKSNIGHCEAASGLVGLIKIIISIQSGFVPANVNITSLATDIEGIRTGQLQVVTKNLPVQKGLFALNSFGFGGANGHIVLKPYTQINESAKSAKTSIVFVSGKTEESVQLLLDEVLKNREIPAFISLLNEIFKEPIKNHTYRGFQVLKNNGPRQIANGSSNNKPIWFCYSGMGSQWPGMARDLMHFPVFKETIRRCSKALKPYDVDLEDILLNGTMETFNYCVNCFTSIVAMSIALTDLLKSVGIEPDGIFGHSLGEIGCAYADGLLTVEEAILVGYARGYASIKSNLQPGLMAAIGLTLENTTKILPKDIEIAAINSNDSITIAGPTDSIKAFVEELSSRDVFARIVNTANLAYHSKYVHPAGGIFKDFLKKVIKEPKLRSAKWLSTSVPQSEWDSEKNKYNSPDYHYNNFMNKVLLKQVLDLVPKDAILIEIAPRGLLQAILKRYLDSSITNISLLNHLQNDNVEFFLSSLGKLYLAGGQPNISVFHSQSKFPVGIDTAMISPLVKWDHQVTWNVPTYHLQKFFGHVIQIDLSKSENKYIFDHIIDGIPLFPASGYVILAWETFAFMNGQLKEQCKVVIKNFRILNGIVLTSNDVLKFIINIFRTTGEFEIIQNNKKVCSGYIYELINEELVTNNCSSVRMDSNVIMNNEECYKMLNLRGYGHKNKFQGIMEFNITSGVQGKIKWMDNWTAYLDAVFSYLFILETTGLCLPISAEKITIDPFHHKKIRSRSNLFTLDYNKYTHSVNCAGVELKNIKGKRVNRKMKEQVTLMSYKFTPHSLENVDEFKAISYTLQTVIENNLMSSHIHIGDYNHFDDFDVIKAAILKKYFKNLSLNFIDEITPKCLKNIQLLLHKDLFKEDEEYINNIKSALHQKAFIYTNIEGNQEESYLASQNFVVVSKFTVGKDVFALIRQKQNIVNNCKVIKIKDNKFDWFREFKAAVTNSNSMIYLVTNYCNSGIIGFFNSIRDEYYCQTVRIYYIKDKDVEEFSLDSEFYKDRINMDLTVNVLKNGVWGSYRLSNIDDITWEDRKYVALAKQRQQLVWQEESPYYRCDDEEITVHYAYIHKWQLHTTRTTNLALEYSGIDQHGNHYMGISPDGSLKTYVKKDYDLTWAIPKSWRLNHASTLPLALTMTYYGLILRAHLNENNSILIYNENNYFTYAAITLAIKSNSKIFVNIEKDEDVENFIKTYPKLKNNIIVSDRKATIELEVMKKTNGKGVDYIFNKVFNDNDDLIDCIAQNGRTIQILLNGELEDLNKYKNHLLIELNDVLKDETILKQINKEIQLLIQANFINPVLEAHQEITCENIFSYFQNNNNANSVIVQIYNSKNNSFKTTHIIKAIAKTFFNPDKVYIVIGGLGGIGLELIDWMVKKGAQKIVINSRRGVKSGYQAAYIEKWRNSGVIIVIDKNNTINYQAAEALMSVGLELGDIGGIFNLGMVLDDGLSYKLTEQQFYNTVAPKLYISENFDKLSQILCPELEYFVVFSSITASLGHAGQSNYAFANSSMEMLCENRREKNLPGLAVEWGPVGEAGYLVEILQFNKKILKASNQSIQSCLNVLDDLMQQNEVIVSSTFYEIEDEQENKDTITSVLDSIGGLFGFKSVSDIDMDMTLINLGMDSIMSFEIRNILMAEFNIDYSANHLRNMSFSDIRSLQRRSSRRVSRYM